MMVARAQRSREHVLRRASLLFRPYTTQPRSLVGWPAGAFGLVAVPGQSQGPSIKCNHDTPHDLEARRRSPERRRLAAARHNGHGAWREAVSNRNRGGCAVRVGWSVVHPRAVNRALGWRDRTLAPEPQRLHRPIDRRPNRPPRAKQAPTPSCSPSLAGPLPSFPSTQSTPTPPHHTP